VKKTGKSATRVLLHALDEGYDASAWHGTTLKGALRGVTARQASWRPAPGRHNIRELVVHAAYWKERVRQRLTGETEAFPHSGSNWFERPGGSEKAWKEERALLDRAHRKLRRAVARLDPAKLTHSLPGLRRRTALREAAGIALHDVYHAGQIQLLKVLQRRKK
jgi:DinB superfamily